MSGRRRLDLELVRRGLVTSREQAQEAVAAGLVLVGGSVAERSSRLVDPGDPVTLSGPRPRFVSRGGQKLDAALDSFAVDVTGRRALDAGASTGGFTDCLLQRGAAMVVAVDVGRGQLHERLARDPRVDSRERTNIRHLSLEQVGGRPFDLVVADLSFISLRTVAPVLVGRLSARAPGADVRAPGADARATGPDARATGPDVRATGTDVVVLIKPQFEAGRQAASAGRGVIRDPAVWSETLLRVIGAMNDQGAAMMGLMVSPLTGADGNVEFLAHFRAHQRAATDPNHTEPNHKGLVDKVVTEAANRHGMEKG